jgi:hypothetical protein
MSSRSHLHDKARRGDLADWNGFRCQLRCDIHQRGQGAKDEGQDNAPRNLIRTTGGGAARHELSYCELSGNYLHHCKFKTGIHG